MGLIRVAKAEALKNLRQNFFTTLMIVFNLLLPFGVGLTYYFIYLPFPHDILDAQGYKMSLTDFTVAGQIVYLLFINMMLVGVIFTRERLQGTLETIFLTPCNRFAVLLGGSLAGLVNYMWFLFGMFSVLFFLDTNPHILSPVAVTLSLMLIAYSTVVLGMLLQVFFVSSRRGSMWGTAMQEPILFLSGIVFPLQNAPLFVQTLASAVPLSYSVLALRASVFAGATVSDLFSTFLFLLVLSVLYTLLTLYGIRLVDVRLRKEGTFQLY